MGFQLQLDEAMLVIRELRGMERGRLRVAADTTAGVYVVPGPLGTFKARYPQITISMSVVNRATVQEKLLAHEELSDDLVHRLRRHQRPPS